MWLLRQPRKVRLTYVEDVLDAGAEPIVDLGPQPA